MIDDDAEAHYIIERMLQDADFTVATASTGEEGIQLARTLCPDVITLDVIMPDMDGWNVLRALKSDPALRDVPVVMLTMRDDKSRGYSPGAADYPVKPVDRETLRQVLHRYASTSESREVLLVDDDPLVRKAAGEVVANAGWGVQQAENGRVALELLAESRPTLILLDLMMPVMDGFEFLLELRANPDARVIVTAKDLTVDDRRFLSGRVEQIVAKDAWSHAELADLVRRVAVSR